MPGTVAIALTGGTVPPQGTTIRITSTYTNEEGVITDPTLPTFKIKRGDEVLTLVYPADPGVIKEASGIYYYDYFLEEPDWQYFECYGEILGEQILGTSSICVSKSVFTGDEPPFLPSVWPWNVSVTQFGARGDGETDDTLAIQMAFDAGQTLGLPVVFPSTLVNRYLITDHLYQAEGVPLWIYAEGGTSLVSDGVVTLQIKPNGEFLMDGLTMRDGVSIGGSEWVVLDSFEVRNCKSFNSNTFVNWHPAAADLSESIGFTRCVITNCQVENCSLYAIRVSPGVIQSCQITNNQLKNVGSRGIQVGHNEAIYPIDWQALRKDIVVTGNTIDGGTQIGIIVYGTDVSIANNAVRNGPAIAIDDTAGIYTKCVRAVVVGNVGNAWHAGEAFGNFKGQPRNMRQQLTITSATNGSTKWVLNLSTYDGTPLGTTAELTYSSTLTLDASAMQAALEAMPQIGVGNVSVQLADGKNAGKIFSIEYINALAGSLAGPLLSATKTASTGTFTFSTGVYASRGYACKIIGNTIVDNAVVTARGAGIKIRCGDSEVTDNIIEGGRKGVDSNADDSLRNIIIARNTIFGQRAASGTAVYGIIISGNATNVELAENHIRDVVGDNAVAMAIKVAKTGDGLRILRNQIESISSTGGFAYTAIQVNEDNEASAASVYINNNRISGCNRAIQLAGASVFAQILGNDINPATVLAPIVYSVTPTTLMIQGDRGIVTQTSGTTTVGAAATSATVAHGITGLPTGKVVNKYVSVSFAGDPLAATKLWFSGVGDTNLTVNLDQVPGGAGVVVRWAVTVVGAIT